MLAAARTPPEIIATLNTAMRKAPDDPEVRRRITSEGGHRLSRGSAWRR
jgi:tripartite-type tricarboxylate transporter receptor subunit TctC